MEGNQMGMNPRWTYGKDTSLTLRMYLVMFMLAALYLFFVTVMMALGVPIILVTIIAGAMFMFQWFGSEKLVLRSMHAKVVTEQEQPKLHAMVDKLVAIADMTKPKVALAMTDVPNAFASGRNQKKAMVCVTDGLVRRLDDDELEGVIAHELSHIKNGDVRAMMLASFFATVAAMLMNMLMWMTLFGGMGRHRGGSHGNSAAGALMMAYFVSILVYFLATLLILALSRYREFAADRGAAMLTGAPSKLASALEKISGIIAQIPTDDLRKVETANAFFIVSALKGEKFAGLFASHPPMQKRIAKLREIELQMERGR
jgi:heat shock protein HtpX